MTFILIEISWSCLFLNLLSSLFKLLYRFVLDEQHHDALQSFAPLFFAR